MKNQTNRFLNDLNIEVPVICGPMYPGSNPELIASVASAGAMGVVQPVTLTHVYGYDFREGLRYIKSMTDKPFGVNFTLMQGVKKYEEMNARWMDIAIEEGIKFFLTSVGNPKHIVRRAHQNGITVYHDASTKKFANNAINAEVDGIICLNNQAGGQTGSESPTELIRSLEGIDVPLICSGGIAQPSDLRDMIELGYSGVLMGTRFLASEECQIQPEYKNALIQHYAEDIVHTNKLAGVPSSVIKTPELDKSGLSVNPIIAELLKNRRTKNIMRMLLSLKTGHQLKRSVKQPGYGKIWQAGTGIEHIKSVESVASILEPFRDVHFSIIQQQCA